MQAEDSPVTMPLVEALIGRSHAELRGEMTTAVEQLGGRIDVLVEAQHGATEQARLGQELASREHRAVEDRLDRLDRKFDTVFKRIAVVERDDQEEAAARRESARWKRRFWAAFCVALPTVTAVTIFAADRLLTS